MAVYGGMQPNRPVARIRFEAIGEAWSLFQQNMGVWIGASLICFLIGGIVVAPFYVMLMGAMIGASAAAGDGSRHSPAAAALGGGVILMSFLMMAAVLVVSAFLRAGMFTLALKQVRGQPIAIGDMFSAGRVVVPLLGLVLISGIAEYFGSIAIVGGYILGGLWLAADLLVIDRGMGPVDALRASWKALQPEWLMAAVFFFVIALIASLGGVVCGIGALFTVPLFFLSIAIIYRDTFDVPANEGGFGPAPSIEMPIPPYSQNQ